MSLEFDIDRTILNEREESNPLTGTEQEQEIFNKFNNSISLIEDKFELLELDIQQEIHKNILRSQIAFLFSCVDYYFHEIIKIGILNIIKEERRETKKLGTCLISIKIYTEYIRSSNLSQDILEEEIIHRNSYKSFLDPDKMVDGLSLITDQNILKLIFRKMGFDSQKKLKEKIKIGYTRRNHIVHQMDFDFSNGSQNEIDKEFVMEYIEFYKSLINEIHLLLLNDNI